MKRFLAFTQKELLEQFRSGKLLFLGILFLLFGIMNPAVAKLTPWLLEMMTDSLAQSGMTITQFTVNALDSWVQFFKNIPMALIAFVLMEGSIFTREYQTGTLVLGLTKGLPRPTVVISKPLVLTLLWSLGYWLCFMITYSYNAYFWDNAIAHSLMFSVVCWWVFGLWVICLAVLFSVLFTGNTGVLLGTGVVVLICYLLGFFPNVSKYLPTYLAEGNSLIYGLNDATNYSAALAITSIMCIGCFVASISIFNKKPL